MCLCFDSGHKTDMRMSTCHPFDVCFYFGLGIRLVGRIFWFLCLGVWMCVSFGDWVVAGFVGNSVVILMLLWCCGWMFVCGKLDSKLCKHVWFCRV